ncbi:hypothetical protein Cantr_10181 [Candida viswanathii]|uniref:Uncharacterized protein n=1 Tax=Candida viswanathii TaxID=5486 RepID=A0A367YCH2_9ASCO|nr:hypothetical protein Cantr_10181 [Candida viswanathii]
MTVPPFRPYGGEDIRVVSDVSRFDYGESEQKIRSRNTTPTNADMLVPDNDDNASSSRLTLDTIIPLYSTKINERSKYNKLSQHDDRNTQHPSPPHEPPTTRPDPINLPKRDHNKTAAKPKRAKYSIAIQVPQDHLGYVKEASEKSLLPPPPPPPKDTLRRAPPVAPYPSDPGQNNNNNLPPMPQPSQMYPPQQPPPQQRRIVSGEGEGDEMTPQKMLEKRLIQQVMNRPVIGIRGDRFGQEYQDKHFTLSANFVLYVFEVCCSIVEIVLSSLLLQNDQDIAGGYYRYLIADGIISLVISFLFAFQIINYEVRNGSFYCLTATICKFAAFIVVITSIFPEDQRRTQEIWNMRRGMGAVIIVSTFLWVINMVMFATTLYISRLNLLEDLNFDYSRKGTVEEYNQLPHMPQPGRDTSGGEAEGGAPVRRSSSRRRKRNSHEDPEEEPLKEFYLNQNGEMYALNEEWEKEQHRGKNKILVYTF